MRIVVYPPAMRIGGSQLNAVELAEQLQARGHQVLVFSEPGPLCARLVEAGIPFEAAPAQPKIRPWPITSVRLSQVARRFGAELVHAYEWPPILEAAYGPRLRGGIPVVGTVMSMGVAPFVPHDVPLVVGTERIARSERIIRRERIARGARGKGARHAEVFCIEPPVDVEANRAGMGRSVAETVLPLADGDFVVVVVSRLAEQLKRDGLIEAIRSAGVLAEELPIRLIVVGDGPVRPELEALAAQQNAGAGREVVTLTGTMLDPRGAYDAADVVLGMGSSALRAMAFAKPVVVQGERGFWALLDPGTVGDFLDGGWYGIGEGGDGAMRLAGILRNLHADPALRQRLGAYSRSLVCERFSLERAAALHEAIYRQAVADPPSRRQVAAGGAAVVASAYKHELVRWWAAKRGSAPLEDFNTISAQPHRARV